MTLDFYAMNTPVQVTQSHKDTRKARNDPNKQQENLDIEMASVLNLPYKKLDCEPGHVSHFYYGEDPEVSQDLVWAVIVGREGVEGEDDGGEDDAAHGEHGDDPGTSRGVGLLEQVPDPLLELPAMACITFCLREADKIENL